MGQYLDGAENDNVFSFCFRSWSFCLVAYLLPKHVSLYSNLKTTIQITHFLAQFWIFQSIRGFPRTYSESSLNTAECYVSSPQTLQHITQTKIPNPPLFPCLELLTKASEWFTPRMLCTLSSVWCQCVFGRGWEGAWTSQGGRDSRGRCQQSSKTPRN